MTYPGSISAVVPAPSGNLGATTPTHTGLHNLARTAIQDLAAQVDALVLEVSGRVGALTAETAGTTKTPRLYNRTGKTWTITTVYASVDTAPTGAGITVILRKNGSGTGAITTTISATANTGSTTGQSLSIADGDYVQAWPTTVGSTVAGTDLSVMVAGTT